MLYCYVCQVDDARYMCGASHFSNPWMNVMDHTNSQHTAAMFLVLKSVVYFSSQNLGMLSYFAKGSQY